MSYIKYINKQILEAIERKDTKALDRLEDKVNFYIEKLIKNDNSRT